MSRDIDKALESLKQRAKIIDISHSTLRRAIHTWVQNPEDYKGELHLFDTSFYIYETAIKRGYIAFVATFAVLRRRQIASVLTRIVQRHQYKLDAPPSGNRPRDRIRKATRFAFDFTISGYALIGVMAYNADYMLLASSLSFVPLVPYQSVISDELCPEIQDMARQLQESPDLEMDHSIMSFVHSFSRNCRLRQAYERKLRKEQGLADNAPVFVPPPGVPMDYTLEENAFAHAGDKDETIADMNDDEWVKSLVNDQEQTGNENDK